MSINSELIYALEDRPPPLKSLFAGVQHLLASFVGIVTPALIIGGVLDLDTEISYLISMSLIASGIGTLIQATQPLGIGAKMLCLQKLDWQSLFVPRPFRTLPWPKTSEIIEKT